MVPADLRQQLAQHLADYMLPAAFVVRATFPLTPNGKLDRKALPAPEQSAVAARGYEAPIGEVETTLAQIWQDLLRLARVGRHDHFFELGGHSLLVVSVIERLRQRGWALDVRTVFTAPVLADLAREIQVSPEEVPAFIVPPNRIPDDNTVLTPEMLPLVTLSQTEIDTIVNRVPGGVTNVQDIYPLAPLQEGILFHHRLDPHRDPYVISSLLCVDSQTNFDAFTAALQTVIDRHDILRTAVHWVGLSQPVQVVHRHAPLPVHRLILEDGDDVVTSLQARMTLSHGPLDLSQAPLIRLQTAADPHSARRYVLIQFHHIINDNLSLRQVLAETAAFLLGKSAALPPSVPYRNFVAYARQESHIQAAETFFPHYLADLDEVTAPFGLINVQEGGEHTGEAQQPLNAGLSRALRKMARRLGTSPAALFHAGWALVIARTSGRDDIVFGTTLSGRMSGMAGSAGALGMFINTLPVRLKLKGISAEALVKAVTDTCVSLLQYEQTPLSLVQRYSGLGNMPLFSALLNCRHVSDDKDNDMLNLAQFGVTSLAGRGRTNYPVGISIDDDGKDFILSAQTVSTVDPNRINAYLVKALEQLVAILADAPHSPALAVDVMPAAERQQLLADFNASEHDFPQTALIHELFEQQAARTPDATAVLFEGQSLSYGELNRRANQLAHHLIALGVQPDDRVAICVERSPAMVVGLLGALKAGGTYVPLDPAYPTERLAYMLADAAPVILLTQTSLAEKLGSDLPTVLLDTPACNTYADNNPAVRALTPHHLAYVIYTSGSTGQPKGVMVEHHGFRNYLLWALSHYVTAGQIDSIVSSPFAFDATVTSIYLPLLCGGKIRLIREGQELTELVPSLLSTSMESSTLVKITPTHLAAMGQELLAAKRTCPAHCFIVGGEALTRSTVALWRELSPESRIVNEYGPTETVVGCITFDTHNQDNITDNVPIGQPIANTRIYILDAQGQPVPVGVAGEIYIGGAGVARGYLNRPALTVERFIPDSFSAEPDARLYKTGDLGRWLPDGNIEYLGRNDFQVKLRGFRIELGEIESHLAQCSGVREAVVIAREDIAGEKRLVAYLRSQSGVELVPAELRQQLAQHLTDYMLPSAFVTLETFPLTSNGKLDRQALPTPEQSAVATRGYEAPEGELETLLAQIWQELLGLERVGRHDHFFELGGHSLMAVSLIERLRVLGQTLDVRSIFSAPILSEMALAIQALQEMPAFIVPPNRISKDCIVLTPDLLPLVALSQTELDAIVDTVPGGAANVQDIYPLAPLQEGILFHHRLQEQGDTYLLNSLVAFDSRTRLDAFLSALQQVIDRHDILRTAICWQGLTQPVQAVWRQASLSVNTFVPTSENNVLAQLQDHIDPRQRRLNLSQAPLLTADIAHDPASHEWLLALSFHHLIGDHMTLELIVDEIRLLLQGDSEELPNSLPYRNFIAQTLSVPVSEHEDYFRARLVDVDTPTAPFGLLNVQGDGGDITEARLLLDTQLAWAIRNQARRLGISPSVLFHVAWAQVLAQTSGCDDVVFGSVLLGRLQGSAGADRVMGMFINTLPLRVSLAGRSALEVVQATYRNLTILLEHEQAPLALAQRCSGVTPPMPLFSALLNYRHSQPDADDTAWDGMRLLATEERNNYPLTLSVDDLGEGFNLVAQTISGVDPSRVTNYLVTAISGLIEALATESQRSILNLPILPATERQQILVSFNNTEADFPREVLLHELFEQQVVRTPDATAVVFEESTLSYGELNRRANRLAHHLLALGIRPDDRVAICIERSLEMMVGLLGILKAGAAYVPLDPAYPAERLAYMLEDAAPVALLTQTGLLETLDSHLPTIVLDARGSSVLDNGPAENLEAQIMGLTSRHLAYVIYTSGSTGKPKGVMIEHSNIVNFLCSMSKEPGMTEEDVLLGITSLSFDISILELFLPLLTGARIILATQAQATNAQQLTALIAHHNVSFMQATPSTWRMLLQMPTFSLPTKFKVLCGGEALPEKLATQLLQQVPTLWNLYGPTETTVWSALNGLTRTSSYIGHPIANTQIYILDTQGQPVPLGVAGEIHIGGVGVARGYLNRPVLTAERFIPDLFSTAPDARMYKTGDLGRWLSDGSIEYLGRNDFQVKLRGFRIELGEIEARLAQCSGVREAVVIAREDIPGDTRLVAYLLLQPDAELVPAELRQQLVQHLAEYMLPSAFVTLETFPLTPNGKLDRKALPAPEQSAVAVRGYEAPIGEMETMLAQIWQDLLGLERVGRHDHFFEIGGHSLMVVQLIVRIQTEFLIDIPIASIFQFPKLSELAEVILSTQVSSAWGNDVESVKSDLDSMSIEELMAILDGDTN
nr:non-ribosomal peptide synthetase [Xenorhabdus lircayensis]